MAGNKQRMVRCYDCKYGKFMQWMKNPIICECSWTKERYVAESRRICVRYEEHPDGETPSITHYDHY